MAIAIGYKGANIQTILVESETEVKAPPRYETKPIIGECSECGLGRQHWFVYFHGSPDRQRKKCEYRFKGEPAVPCPFCNYEGGAT